MNNNTHFLTEGKCACGNNWPCEVRDSTLIDWGFNIKNNSSIGAQDGFITIREQEKIPCVVEIPKGGCFYVQYKTIPSLWSRMWMRFIGWGVTVTKEDD